MIARRDILRAIVASPLGGWLPSWAPIPDGIALGPDASSHYLQAFSGLSRLTEADRALIQSWKTASLNGPIRGLLRRASPALSALRRGASIPGCAWGEAIHLDALGRGHLDVSNLQIGKVALLRARSLVESGRGTEAVDDIFAVISLGRHIGRAGLLIARIYQLSMENESIGLLAASLDRLDRPTLEGIPARIAALPASCDWAETMRLEARFITSTVAERIEAAPSPIDVESLKEAGLSADHAAAVLERTGGDRARVLAVIEGVSPFLEGLAGVLSLPMDACSAALERYRQGAEAINPFGASVVMNAEGLKYAVERTAVLWKMLGAARVLIVEGPESFRAIADPFGDGPFAYRSLANGFELRSALGVEGKPPAILTVGRLPIPQAR